MVAIAKFEMQEISLPAQECRTWVGIREPFAPSGRYHMYVNVYLDVLVCLGVLRLTGIKGPLVKASNL